MFPGSCLPSFCWLILLMNSASLPRIGTPSFLAFAKKPKRWTKGSFHGQFLSMASTLRRKSFRRCCNMPLDPLLHERSDFKALVETVADSEKINDPALVEKDYWIMHAVFGLKQVCQQIQESKRLRMLVPRIYGLGDLSQILDDRAYKQAKVLLSSLREDLSKVVLTGAYRRAADALNKHGFVLLIGEPAAGKTTIASMLSIGALDQWDASTLKLDSAEKVTEHWNPDEPSQFFWIDDAFGVTQYESFLVHGWNHALPMVRTMLRKDAKIVMTSRDYIYKRARNDLKEGAFPLLRESQVVIDVCDLTLEEKQQILYNHMKLGRQEKPFRTAIKPHLPSIASHSRFIPETARRLADPLFTDG